MKDYYGWRARIGLIYMASSTVMEPEFYAMAPEGVTIHTARIPLPEASVRGLRNMMEGDRVEVAAGLLGQAPLHVVTFGGTSATFLEGIGYDEQVIARMEGATNGIPASATSTAALRALRKLGVKKVSFVGPYIDEVTERGRRFFEQNGYEVTGAHGMGVRGDPDINAIPLERTYEFAKRSAEPEAEAVFISCTGLRTIGAIEPLEQDLGKPVVSAVQATFWDALRIAGVGDRVTGFGSLFAH
jgi:maleate isomerase